MSEVSDAALDKYAKMLVVNCVRNTFLEDIHSGNAKLGDNEMKQLMKEIVNKVYTFLKYANDSKFMSAMNVMYPHDWDAAELDDEFVSAIKIFKDRS